MDLTLMPTRAGFWVPWFPSALVQRWPFCWWIAVIQDHFSRRIVGFAAFHKETTSEEMCSVLDRAVERAGYAPKYTISDQGVQFGQAFRAWCKQNGVKHRFGAIGRYGSIATLERFIKTLKSEGLRRILVPSRLDAMCECINRYLTWYNEHRPHSSLAGATPSEVYDALVPANQRPRIEPRARYPVHSPCASPQVPIGRRVDGVVIDIRAFEGEKHLPIVELRDAA